jgi:hypothetical protein
MADAKKRSYRYFVILQTCQHPKHRMVGSLVNNRILQDLEGTVSGLIKVLSCNFSTGSKKNHEESQLAILAKIQLSTY